MIDVPSIFRNKTPDTDKLTAYGFCPAQAGYEKRFPIMRDQYTVLVRLTPEGEADFSVFDCETNEEYLPAHVHGATGSFVGEIHQACESVLRDIADKCCRTEHFKGEQAKRILRLIKETYNAEPEFLWSRLPECAALRVPGQKPWFAVVGCIPKEKIGIQEGGMAEVLNLKDDPKAVKTRLDEKKAYPAYHMNKQHWYTILLDDSLEDEEILRLVGISFETVQKKIT